MANTVHVIGIDAAELSCIRLLVFLLRHPDPVVPELTRQALRHIKEVLARSAEESSDTLDHAG